MERREILGNVVSTTLSSSISNTATTISVSDGSTFPDGSSGNSFVIVLDRGNLSEEKLLCSSRTSNTITVSQRGYDGTPAGSHSAGALVDHVLDATTIQDMNSTTYNNQILHWMEAS